MVTFSLPSQRLQLFKYLLQGELGSCRPAPQSTDLLPEGVGQADRVHGALVRLAGLDEQ
jgi:hypothetical protein